MSVHIGDEVETLTKVVSSAAWPRFVRASPRERVPAHWRSPLLAWELAGLAYRCWRGSSFIPPSFTRTQVSLPTLKLGWTFRQTPEVSLSLVFSVEVSAKIYAQRSKRELLALVNFLPNTSPTDLGQRMQQHLGITSQSIWRSSRRSKLLLNQFHFNKPSTATSQSIQHQLLLPITSPSLWATTITFTNNISKSRFIPMGVQFWISSRSIHSEWQPQLLATRLPWRTLKTVTINLLSDQSAFPC